MDISEISIPKRIQFARQMAKEAGLAMKAAGDGLFRLEGQDHLMSATQILMLLKDGHVE